MMKRGKSGLISIQRRVPKRYASVEPRRVVWISLGTDSTSVAGQKATAVWDEMIAGWEAKLAGNTQDAESRFEAARKLALSKGFRYLPIESVAALPIDDFLKRIESIQVSKAGPNLQEAAAVLGAVSEPGITVSRALSLFWSLAAEKKLKKSPDQIRRWENPIKKSVKNFIDVIGDKRISDISREDMLDFRQWWLERLETEGMTPNSANKDLTHFGAVLKRVNEMKRLGFDLPLSGLAFKQGEKVPRPSFTDEWLRERIMAPGALDGLNAEARCILLGMINTGYRPSEGAGLKTDQIHLDTTVPYISIDPVDRQVKTANSRESVRSSVYG